MLRRAAPRRKCTGRSAGFAPLACLLLKGDAVLLGESDFRFAGGYLLCCSGRCFVGLRRDKDVRGGRQSLLRLPACFSEGDAVPPRRREFPLRGGDIYCVVAVGASSGCAEAKLYGAVGRLCFARLPASQGDAVPLGSPPAGVRASPRTPASSASRSFRYLFWFLPRRGLHAKKASDEKSPLWRIRRLLNMSRKFTARQPTFSVKGSSLIPRLFVTIYGVLCPSCASQRASLSASPCRPCPRRWSPLRCPQSRP